MNMNFASANGATFKKKKGEFLILWTLEHPSFLIH